MDIKNSVFKDSSIYGKKRLEIYIGLQDFQSKFITIKRNDLEDIISSTIPMGDTYSIGLLCGLLLVILENLIDLDNTSGTLEFNTWIQARLSELKNITLDQSALKDLPGVQIINASNSDTSFNVKFIYAADRELGINFDITESLSKEIPVKVKAEYEGSGNSYDFTINDDGNLYNNTIEKSVLHFKKSEMSEAYRRGHIVKDLLDNHFKITKADSKYYKVRDAYGSKKCMEKEGFEAVTKLCKNKKYLPPIFSCVKESVSEVDLAQKVASLRSRINSCKDPEECKELNSELESYVSQLEKSLHLVKEDISVGGLVSTPNGKGKVTKVEKDNIWVQLDNDTTIDGISYPKGSEVAYKDKSLVKESAYNIRVDKEYEVPRNNF